MKCKLSYFTILLGILIITSCSTQKTLPTAEFVDSHYYKSLFNTIAINPYSQMISCCGLTSEYIISLRLGSVKESEIKHLYESQFQDFLKIWLFIEGPMSVLKFIYEKRGVQFGFITGHICNICSEIFKDQENIKILQEYYKEVMVRVLLKYSLYTKSHCLT